MVEMNAARLHASSAVSAAAEQLRRACADKVDLIGEQLRTAFEPGGSAPPELQAIVDQLNTISERKS